MPDLSGLIPGTKTVNKTELSEDLVVIQNMKVIPSPPLNAGDKFSVFFELKNQDELKTITVNWKNFDYGLCSPLNTPRASSGSVSLAPLQTEFMEWSFNAPSNEQIAYLTNKCPIRFKITYNYKTTSQIDASVMSDARYIELQKSGNPPSYTPNLVVGRGPIKTYMSFGAALPVRSGSSLPIFITVEDKGTGMLSSIPAGALTLNFNGISVNCGDRFNDCSSGTCTNKEIPIIQKKTSILRCSLTAPTVDPEKTYYFTASLDYNYELELQIDVTVKPLPT